MTCGMHHESPRRPHPASGKGDQKEDYHGRIDQLADEAEKSTIQFRHQIHQHPELANREHKTAKLVADHLKKLKFDEVHTDIAPTGVVGILKGGKPGKKVIALRADMDALPVKEQVDVPFKSEVVDEDYPGGPFPVMHACGHDAHTAMLMGACEVLAGMRDEIPGTVMAVFQPAEEGPPIGEPFGGVAMLEAGVFEDPKPDACFGIHTFPYPVGHIGYADGTQTAAASLIKIHIQGKQVHGSTPWLGLDPLPVLATINDGFGQIYRQIDANQAITISIGKVDTVGRTNIIGEEITLWGTVRCVHDNVMASVTERLQRVVENAAQVHGLTATLEIEQPVASVVNTREWIEKFTPSLERVVGHDKMHIVEPNLGMTTSPRSSGQRAACTCA